MAASRARALLPSTASGSTRCPAVSTRFWCFRSDGCESLWWSATQVDNLARILDRLKRTYNVDENRVYLTGVSDGGTGVYFMAFRDVTPWASFLPLIGHMVVLGTPSVLADGEMYPGNAVNKPFYIVNTGRDRMYPAHVTQIYVEHLRRLGGSVVFRVYPEAGPFNGVVAERPPGVRVVRARSIHASRCPTGFRGRPSGSIGSTARTGWSSIGLGPLKARAGCPTRTCCARARARLRPADQPDGRSRPPRARGRGGLERVSARPARRRSVRRGERQACADGARHRRGYGDVD